jgi:hypothetical protein
MKLITTREVSIDECDWLTETIPKGTELYAFDRHTYGAITPNGIAASMVENQYLFF